jgi:acetyl-CoA carboxylase carboxyl transferase subunit alpha
MNREPTAEPAFAPMSFEQPIAQLEQQIADLRFKVGNSGLDLDDELARFDDKLKDALHKTYSKLSAAQVVEVARHIQRPYTLDYLDGLFTDWQELHGDRHFGDDPALVCGVARFDNQPCVVVGQQKGRDTKSRSYRNFGMPNPEGYRKALRLFKLAEKFKLPIFSFIDTPGAFPGISAEERNQSEAIARNLFELSQLKTMVIATVIGEGGSGGALAIGVADVVMMLQYSVYSVISPEGCASILFKSASRAAEASAAMRLTAPDILKMGLIDEVVPEPLGGAHRNPAAQMQVLGERLRHHLAWAQSQSLPDLLERRYQRLMSYGVFQEPSVVTALRA